MVRAAGSEATNQSGASTASRGATWLRGADDQELTADLATTSILLTASTDPLLFFCCLPQLLQHLLRVPVHLDVVPALLHLPVRADEVRRARDAHVLLAVVRLLLPDAVLVRDLVLGIGEEGEVEVVLLRELRLARLVQDADAEDGRLARLETRQVVAERAGLLGAAGGVVLRIEVQDHGPAGVFRELVGLSALVLQGEGGRFLSGIDQGHARGSSRV